MEVEVQVQGGAKALDERDGAALAARHAQFAARAPAQGREQGAHEGAQDGRAQVSVVGQAVAQRKGQRGHPLADRDPGSTQSTRRAAVSAMRRPPQDGQKPRPLQENGTRRSWPQTAQRTRRKPKARIPQRGSPELALHEAREVRAGLAGRRARKVSSSLGRREVERRLLGAVGT